MIKSQNTKRLVANDHLKDKEAQVQLKVKIEKDKMLKEANCLVNFKSKKKLKILKR